MVARLLTAAVADTAVSVRRQVLRAYERTLSLDTYLAQADCLRALFVALNDEDVKVRALAIEVRLIHGAGKFVLVLGALPWFLLLRCHAVPAARCFCCAEGSR